MVPFNVHLRRGSDPRKVQMSEGWEQDKFDAALKDYITVSRRTVPEVINRKAYFIARKSLWFTVKADAPEIRSRLNRTITIERTTASGRTELSHGPFGAILIDSRLGKKGQPGLYGAAMREALAKLIAARVRSVAFLKAGWLPAIRILDSIVNDKEGAAPFPSEANRMSWSPKQIGDAVAAKPGDLPFATIVNAAIASHDSRGALQIYGSRALDTAFYDETQSMIEETRKRMQKDADKANAQMA